MWDTRLHPNKKCRHVESVKSFAQRSARFSRGALCKTRLTLSTSRASASSFTFRVSSTRFRDNDVNDMARFVDVFETDRSNDESGYQAVYKLVILTSTRLRPGRRRRRDRHGRTRRRPRCFCMCKHGGISRGREQGYTLV